MLGVIKIQDPFSDMLTDTIILEKQTGKVIKGIHASVQKDKIFINDGQLLIEEGDILTRILSNGATERYEVLERGFYEEWEGIPAHYQCDVRKLTAKKYAPDNTRVTNNYFNAPNTRYNENSVDHSINISVDVDSFLFDEIKSALENQIQNQKQLQNYVNQVDEMRNSVGTVSFKEKYFRFIQSLGEHITVVTPFLPKLTEYLMW